MSYVNQSVSLACTTVHQYAESGGICKQLFHPHISGLCDMSRKQMKTTDNCQIVSKTCRIQTYPPRCQEQGVIEEIKVFHWNQSFKFIKGCRVLEEFDFADKEWVGSKFGSMIEVLNLFFMKDEDSWNRSRVIAILMQIYSLQIHFSKVTGFGG